MSEWKFEFVTSLDGAFSPQTLSLWRSLPQGHVFNSPEIIGAWMRSFGVAHHITPLWAVGHTSDGNRSLWPLVIWHRNWKNAFTRVVMPAGGGDFDYHSPMFEQPADISTYLSDLLTALHARGGFDEIVLSGLPDTMLQGLQGKAGRLSISRDEICPQLDLSEIPDEEALLAFFKSSLRGDLRRQWRRLEELGELRLVEFRTWKEASKEFDAFMTAHARRWPNAYKVPGLHRALLQDDLLQGPVSFSALKCGDKTVAWHLGFRDNNRFYYYMPAGNPEFMKFSPVKVHLWKLVSKAIDDGLNVYDHLRGDELYKGGWSNGHQYVNTLSSHANTPTARAKRTLMRLRNLLK